MSSCAEAIFYSFHTLPLFRRLCCRWIDCPKRVGNLIQFQILLQQIKSDGLARRQSGSINHWSASFKRHFRFFLLLQVRKWTKSSVEIVCEVCRVVSRSLCAYSNNKIKSDSLIKTVKQSKDKRITQIYCANEARFEYPWMTTLINSNTNIVYWLGR